jgi:hypothetical protein
MSSKIEAAAPTGAMWEEVGSERVKFVSVITVQMFVTVQVYVTAGSTKIGARGLL